MASSYTSTLTPSLAFCRVVADDGTFLLPFMANGGRVTLIVGTDEERTDCSIDATGNVSLIMASANVVVNADTDTKFCIGTSVANPITIKNRLGAAKAVIGSVWYG